MGYAVKLQKKSGNQTDITVNITTASTSNTGASIRIKVISPQLRLDKHVVRLYNASAYDAILGTASYSGYRFYFTFKCACTCNDMQYSAENAINWPYYDTVDYTIIGGWK